MARFLSVFGPAALLLLATLSPAAAAPTAIPMVLPDRVLGKADAPIRVDEYVSLACSHCAHFYTTVLPELEKRYVDTGKVKFVFHDFVLDGASLKAAQVARCMPEEEFFPFVKVLYENQGTWIMSPTLDKTIMGYAKLGGLTEEKGEECLKNTKLQDAIVAERQTAVDKYKVDATPTFVINNGEETLRGSASVDVFAQMFDRMLKTTH